MIKISKNLALFPLIAVLLVCSMLIFFSYHSGIEKNFDKVVPEAIEDNTWAISIAISDLEYGLNEGYMFYPLVFIALNEGGMTKYPSHLKNLGMNFPDNLKMPDLLNKAIEKARNIKVPKKPSFRRGEITAMPYTDLGLADYYKLSFRLFGFQVDSAYKLFFLILTISILVFVIEYRDRPAILLLPLAFLFLQIEVMDFIYRLDSIDLATVANFRYISVLAIIPAAHVFLLLFKTEIVDNKLRLILLLSQCGIILFVISVRSSALWIIISALLIISVHGFVYSRTNFKKLISMLKKHNSFLLFLATIISMLYLLKMYNAVASLFLLKFRHAVNALMDNPLVLLWLLFFFILFCFFAYQLFLRRKEFFISVKKISYYQIFPALLLVVLFLAFQIHQAWKMHPAYSMDDFIPHHMRYHNAYLALGQHPEFYSRFGDKFKEGLDKNFVGDGLSFNTSFLLIKKEYEEKGMEYKKGNFLSPYSGTIKMGLHDRYIAKAYINFIIDNPAFVIEVHFNKLKKLWWLWNDVIGKTKTFERLLIISIVFLAFHMVALSMNKLSEGYIRTYGGFTAIFIAMALCVHIPSIYAYPSRQVSSDQFFVLSLSIIIFISWTGIFVGNILRKLLVNIGSYKGMKQEKDK